MSVDYEATKRRNQNLSVMPAELEEYLLFSEGPRLLDLFCGEGGAAEGYTRAGFDVFGVDNSNSRLRYYPFPFINYDALEFVIEYGHLFDAIHASPTCTGYSRGTAAIPDRFERYDRLIEATREAILPLGKPYVIENVADAHRELINPTMLCWSMFNEPGSVLDTDETPLRMERHRLFESNVPLESPGACNHPSDIQVAGAYGGARRDKWEAKHIRKGGYVPPSLEVLRELTGLDWATEKGCFLSIPPVYSEYVGKRVLEFLDDQDA